MIKKNNFKDSLKADPQNMDRTVNSILSKLSFYYQPDTKEAYKSHFSLEYQVLKSYFANIDFHYEGRIKNFNSLNEKVRRKLNENKSGRIYDIFAKKIIVYSINGSNEESLLKDACYQINNFLTNYNSHILPITDKCKDYIATPKSNGYQAIHLLRKHSQKSLEPYCSETQIRTFNMEEEQKFGAASHMLSYKPSEILKPELCPIFLEIGRNGKTYELSPKDSFEKYKRDYDAIKEYFNETMQK